MAEEVPADPELSAGSATRTPAATSNESQDQSAPSNNAAASTSQPHQLPDSLASASNASAGPSSSSAAGPSGSSSASLDTIDDICIAITSIDSIHGNPNAQYKRVCQSLLPALQHLESKGTHLGVPGAVVLCSPLQGNHDPLQVLLTQIPPNGVGLGYLFILVARCYTQDVDVQYVLPFIMQYIQAADPYQLRLVPQKVTALANAMSGFMQNQPADAIAPLMALNSKLQGDSRHYLTAVHSTILYAALRSSQFGQVVPLLLDQPVTDVDMRDNLRYHLYGGAILATIYDYEHAVQWLETAITAPCHAGATSLLQIDAYKQLILSQLLLNGKTTALPKYTSPTLLSTFRQLCNTSYLEFAKVYETLDTAKIVDLATQQRKVFEQDGTLGLVVRCMNLIPARKIIKLADIYKTIEIQDVIRSLDILKTEAEAPGESIGQVLFRDIEQAKAYVRQVVQALAADKTLAAVINAVQEGDQGEFLEFLTLKPSAQESAMALQKSLHLLRNSSWTVSNLDNSLSSSREFLGKAYAISGRGSGGFNPVGGMGASTFDAAAFQPGAFGMEEDLMGEQDLGNEVWD